MKFCRCIVLLLLMQSGVVLADSSVRRDTEGRIGMGRYITGGVVGTTLGFGIGHAMQERYWRDYGWVFTVGGVLTTLALVASGLSSKCRRDDFDASRNASEGGNAACVAQKERDGRQVLTVWALFKAIEAVAVWWPRNVSFDALETKAHEANDDRIPRLGCVVLG